MQTIYNLIERIENKLISYLLTLNLPPTEYQKAKQTIHRNLNSIKATVEKLLTNTKS